MDEAVYIYLHFCIILTLLSYIVFGVPFLLLDAFLNVSILFLATKRSKVTCVI